MLVVSSPSPPDTPSVFTSRAGISVSTARRLVRACAWKRTAPSRPPAIATRVLAKREPADGRAVRNRRPRARRAVRRARAPSNADPARAKVRGDGFGDARRWGDDVAGVRVDDEERAGVRAEVDGSLGRPRGGDDGGRRDADGVDAELARAHRGGFAVGLADDVERDAGVGAEDPAGDVGDEELVRVEGVEGDRGCLRGEPGAHHRGRPRARREG